MLVKVNGIFNDNGIINAFKPRLDEYSSVVPLEELELQLLLTLTLHVEILRNSHMRLYLFKEIWRQITAL